MNLAQLKVLIVEDSDNDVALVLRELRQGGYAVEHKVADTSAGMRAALDAGGWDIVLSDFSLPGFSGMEALEIVRSRAPELPFILVSGTVGEEMAVAALKAGAGDYVMKSALGKLVPAVKRELREAEVRRSKRLADEALVQANLRLRALSSRMLGIQESERSRLARELHDQIGQALTAIKINLQSLLLRSDTLRAAPHIEDSIQIVDATIAQVRDLSLALRPPQLDDLGLVAALRWHLDRQARASGIAFRFDADPAIDGLAPDLQSACFRIVQEAVNNALRHARPREIKVRLRADSNELSVLVGDDGDGFDVDAARRDAATGRSLGLISMEERAALAGGRLECRSAPGKGAEIHARLPLHGAGADAAPRRNGA
ncbi:MAG TPA: response regulator [Burkholderiales bacterium]|nr:response regulator [Burkholderiales bacterium]